MVVVVQNSVFAKMQNFCFLNIECGCNDLKTILYRLVFQNTFKKTVKKQFKAKNCEKILFSVTREHVLTRAHINKYSEFQMVFSFAILLNNIAICK
jgi:hypothetical protein